MHSYQPSPHTILMNLAISLCKRTGSVIKPILLDNHYSVDAIEFKIRMSNKKEASPDTGFSSEYHNSIFFIECKSGEIDYDKECPHTKKFEYIQNNESTILQLQHPFHIGPREDLDIDFAFLCSDIEKIKRNNEIEEIKFPIIHYDAYKKILQKSDINNAVFKKAILNTIFQEPLKVCRETVIHIPFLQDEDINEMNLGYLLKNIILQLIKYNIKQQNEKYPSLEDLIIMRYPIMQLIYENERKNILKFIVKFLESGSLINPASGNTTKLQIEKIKGKHYINKNSLPKFLEIVETASFKIEENNNQKKIFSTTLDQFDNFRNLKPIDDNDLFDFLLKDVKI